MSRDKQSNDAETAPVRAPLNKFDITAANGAIAGRRGGWVALCLCH